LGIKTRCSILEPTSTRCAKRLKQIRLDLNTSRQNRALGIVSRVMTKKEMNESKDLTGYLF